MQFWEAVGLVGAMATILVVFMTIYGLINNRTLKEEMKSVREILLRIEQGQNEARREGSQARNEMAEAIRHVADLIVLEGEKTRQAIRAPS